jgi:hypothetical protein
VPSSLCPLHCAPPAPGRPSRPPSSPPACPPQLSANGAHAALVFPAYRTEWPRVERRKLMTCFSPRRPPSRRAPLPSATIAFNRAGRRPCISRPTRDRAADQYEDRPGWACRTGPSTGRWGPGLSATPSTTRGPKPGGRIGWTRKVLLLLDTLQRHGLAAVAATRRG